MLKCRNNPLAGSRALLGVIVLCSLFTFLFIPTLEAQSIGFFAPLARTVQDDPLVVKIAVIGPGDELFLWWGHIGLIIEDQRTGDSRFYDWGVFSFENENFYYNFAFGRLLYSCAVSYPEWNIRRQTSTNRDATIYTLNLSPEKKEEVRRYAEWSVLPENRDYYYHHFDDNCATRIRDIIDLATDGQFRAKYENTPGRFTLRQHVRRHTWFSFFPDWFLCFIMGQGIDKPITVWDEMFLPAEIGARIQEFTYLDSRGNEQKLLQSTEIVYRAVNRPAVLDTPHVQWPRELLVGCLTALVLGMLILFRPIMNSKAARISWALLQGLLGFFFGIAGTILCFMSFFTNHDYTYRNINVLFNNPLLLASLPMGILFCIGYSSGKSVKWEKRIKTLWSIMFGLGIISMPINLVFLGQQNAVDLALFLPIAAVLSWVPEIFLTKLTKEKSQRINTNVDE